MRAHILGQKFERGQHENNGPASGCFLHLSEAGSDT